MESLRKINIVAAESFGKDSIKAQLRQADKMNIPFALILGQKEALDGTIIIRDMKCGMQEVINIEKLESELEKRLKNS